MGVTGLDRNWTAHLETVAGIQQSLLPALVAGACGVASAAVRDAMSLDGATAFFRGTADQVGQVRRFAMSVLDGHDAVDLVVLAASELATNAPEHTRSGRQGGMFSVHLAEAGASYAALVVTDLGGPGEPAPRPAGADAESGRGLVVVRSVSAVFRVIGDQRPALGLAAPDGCLDRGQMRSVAAVISADAP